MDGLSDHFRLKEYDRIKLEKECMTTLKKVIDVCLKKDYIFNVHSGEGISSISVTTDGWDTSFTSYFKGSLINYSDGNTIPMHELLHNIKK
jgi:hypothetical protein